MVVNITNVEFLNNPAHFLDNYQFRVTFECSALLNDDIEWKLVFVSSPYNEGLDQELDSVVVGPIPTGVNRFEFDANPPDPDRIPREDLLGIAALIFTGSYRDQEFVRVGYYQHTEYDNEDMRENPPENIVVDRLVRDINTKPRVTRFQIKWDVAPSSSTTTAMGAANSAPVPSADDIGKTDEDMEVDKNVNGIS